MRAGSIMLAAMLAAGTGTLSAGTALAGGNMGSAGDAASQEQSRTNPSRRICRSLLPTGSRLPQRTCRTQAEWDADAEQTRRDQERVQGTGTRGFDPTNLGGVPGGGPR